MTDKELHRLRKTELLEILFAMRKELDAVKQENEELQKKLKVSETQKMAIEEISRTLDETKALVQQLCPTQPKLHTEGTEQ